MEAMVFIKGLALGFSIAAPVGPIGLLCIRRTLAEGWITGVSSGLGAATADALYGSIAAFGLTALAAFLLDAQLLLRVGGGCFLLYLGYATYQSGDKMIAPQAEIQARNTAVSFASTFLLTLTNPMTILSFAGVFAGMGLAGANGGYLSSGLMVAGVFAGSLLWWLLLCSVIHALRERIELRCLGVINKFAGVVLAIFGLLAVLSQFGG